MLKFSGVNRTMVHTATGVVQEVTALVAFDASYITGGMPLNCRDLGLRLVTSIKAEDARYGYIIRCDRVSDRDYRMRVYLPSGTHMHNLSVTEASFNDLRVLYFSPTLGLVLYDADTTAVQHVITDANTSSVAVEVAAGTDLSALTDVVCQAVGS